MFGFQPAARRFAQQPEKPQRFAAGGMVRGPGTGTSDSIEAEVEPGTFIMPADSTQAIGPEALRGMGKVPVRLSNGEFEVPPEQAMALGIAVLKAMKDATHAPVNGQDGGQTDEEVAQAKGFAPAAARATRAPVARLFADGGAVGIPTRPNSFGDASAAAADPSVTRVNTGGSDTFGRAAATPASASSPSSAPVAAPTPSSAAAGFQPASARMNALSDPRSSTYDPNPNASSNASMLANYASSIGTRGLVEQGMTQTPAPATARNSFGDAAAAMLDPTVTQVATGFRPASQRTAPMSMTAGVGGFQPRSYADGGVVQDDKQRQALVSQIPTGGMTAPAADGSQNNPLNNEVGRNALNTLSALPGVGGLAARVTAPAARAAGGLPAAVERAAPAAWEVVQDGGALASRTAGAANPAAGALTRAASLAPDVAATGAPGRAAQMLGGPPGQIVQRGATELGDAIPMAGARARGATPWADVVDPLALGGPGAGQAGAAAAQGTSGLGRMAAAGGAGGLAAAAMLSGDSPAGVPSPTAGTAAPTSTPPAAQPRSMAVEALMGPPMSASGSITRDGNSYSGPANLSGDVSIRNPGGSLRAPSSVSVLPNGGAISAQNMAAADALASRENAASLGRLGLAGGAPGFSGVIGQQGNGNMWSRTPEQQRQDALTQVSSIDRRTAARGAAALNAMDAQALQGIKSQGDVDVARLQDQGLMNRTLITERGNNTRAAITAQGQAAAAALKAQQGNKPPEGYRWTAAGGLEAIPGGPAAAKVADQQQTREAGFDATRQTIGTINRLLANNNGLTGATGMIGVQRFFPGTDAADFASQVETLKAQTFLPMVQQLRGMGALSNAEGDKLNAAVGALNFNMSEKAFAESLGRIRDQLSAAMQKAGYDTRDVGGWGLEPPSTAAETASARPTAGLQQPAQRTVTRTGTVNGRRVNQYSDGSVEYAN